MLPDLHISNKSIERKSLIKFLGVWLDEHITWNNHIYAIEKKLVKSIGLLYTERETGRQAGRQADRQTDRQREREREFLDKESVKTIYFLYIHFYLNYANIALASTYFTKLKIYYQQKHAARIISNDCILTHSRSFTIAQCFKYLPNLKRIRHQKYLIWLLKTLPINILPSFEKLT